MKITDILKENTYIDLFKEICNTEFFKLNYEKNIHKLIDNDSSLDDLVWFYHASSGLGAYGTFPQEMRTLPRDTNLRFHDLVNQHATQTVGVPVRNLTFGYTKRRKTKDYGSKSYVLFPMSKDYELYYASHIDDMTDMYGMFRYSESRFNKTMKGFLRRHGIHKHINYISNEMIERFNALTYDSEIVEFTIELFNVLDLQLNDYNNDELAEMLTDYLIESVEHSAKDYSSRLKATKMLEERSEEYMLKSQTIAYLNVDEHLPLFKEFLIKRYL